MAKAKPTPALPPSHLEAIAAAGFDVLSWQNVSADVLDSTGAVRREWLPRHLVNWQTKAFVEYREAGDGIYDFDGWESQIGHANGGRYDSVHGALGWFTWSERQKQR